MTMDEFPENNNAPSMIVSIFSIIEKKKKQKRQHLACFAKYLKTDKKNKRFDSYYRHNKIIEQILQQF